MLRNESSKVFVVPGYAGELDIDYELASELGFERFDATPNGGLLIHPNFETGSHDEKQTIYEGISRVWPGCEFVNRVSNSRSGNASGIQIRDQVTSLEPMRIPKIASQWGAEGYLGRRPAFRITPEAITQAIGFPTLVVLPKSKKKKFEFSGQVVAVLATYGIDLKPLEKHPTHCLAELPWLSELRENQYWFELSSSSRCSIEVLLALLCHALEIIDTQMQQLSVAHLIGEIEGNPRIREFWTSPPA